MSDSPPPFTPVGTFARPSARPPPPPRPAATAGTRAGDSDVPERPGAASARGGEELALAGGTARGRAARGWRTRRRGTPAAPVRLSRPLPQRLGAALAPVKRR